MEEEPWVLLPIRPRDHQSHVGGGSFELWVVLMGQAVYPFLHISLGACLLQKFDVSQNSYEYQLFFGCALIFAFFPFTC
jgi:hypothetical protein